MGVRMRPPPAMSDNWKWHCATATASTAPGSSASELPDDVIGRRRLSPPPLATRHPMIKLAQPIIEDEERAPCSLRSIPASSRRARAWPRSSMRSPNTSAQSTPSRSPTAPQRCTWRCSRTASALHRLQPTSNDRPDEVIVPAFTFAATANMVLLVGAAPCSSMCARTTSTSMLRRRSRDHAADARDRRRAPLRPDVRHRAVAAICKRHGIALIEDAAQAVGASSRQARRCVRHRLLLLLRDEELQPAKAA